MNDKLTVVDKGGMEVASPQKLTSLDILESAVRGGITSENVAVVKEIIAMRREEVALEAKSKFNRAFFKLRQEIATMEFYADKVAKNDSGVVMYTSCSEKELSSKLEPVLSKHSFAMLFGQEEEGEKTAAVITLIHADGHEETRRYWVRSGGTNRVKDATMADTGATTSAWRHLVIKMFGLKSRISETNDAKNLGSLITTAEAEELQRRAILMNSNQVKLLKLGGVIAATPTLADYMQLTRAKYEVVEQMLAEKERTGR